ncbi:MAG TPA: AcvB/VirJ family lysyl-phosphatidylglycerol hydrolase [Longimicrobiaceae bacterium]|nr:AcvB/VirJ family lysyl-phosphatidylglycerol hydrolase [Longimicrobiaceae bacterium]
MRRAASATSVVALGIALAGCALTAPSVMPSAPELRDLPLVTVEPDSIQRGGPMAVVLSGDGGWAGHVRRISRALVERGIPVVGWNSLRYYWRHRSPEEASQDLARVIDYYHRHWGTGPVIVVGYSFGADVAPFEVALLPDSLRAGVAEVAVVGYSGRGDFEFHIPMWWGSLGGHSTPADPRMEEIAADGIPVLCINGQGEDERGCETLHDPGIRTVLLPTGHQFSGFEDEVVRMILTRYAQAYPTR